MIFDATIFEADDVTPFFGTGDGLGGVVVPDFSTDPAHPRPYLFEVKDWAATEIDFPAGSSNLGGITLEVLDKRTDSADQGTGILTARLGQVKGKRLLLRRLHPTDGMIPTFEAVVLSYSMGGGPEGLVKITLQLRDIRERERGQPLFLSNFVLFGADGAQGPAINYGAKPGGGYLLDAVAPFESIVSGGISHFERLDGFELGGGIIAGLAAIPGEAFAAPAGLLYPQQDADGIWRYRGIQVRWRAKGSADPWITLRDMPWINAQPVVTSPNNSIVGEAFAGSPLFRSATTLRFSSLDEYDIPEDDQEIEFQVLAVEITEETPFWWDGGTFGDLLKEIYDGDHSVEPPKIRYSAADMAAFRTSTPSARFILRKPVKDMREWVEKYIYQPLGYAPGFDVEMAISPVAWAFPANTESIPLIDAETLVPIGDWQDGPDNVINQVFFTYIRESLESTRTIQQTKAPPWWKFWAEDVQTQVPDPEDTRLAWQRLIETPVRNEHLHLGSIAAWGVKDLDISGILARSIAGADGSPYGGDTQDELGARMDAFITEQALGRFYNGAPSYTGAVLASDPRASELRGGSWVRLRYWPPNYDTGERGVRRYFQVISISDEDASKRILKLIDGGVPDTSDDVGGIEPGGTDCASGGALFPAAGGAAVRKFIVSGELVTTCAITADLLAIAGGGGGGFGSDAGGGGGAGGVKKVAAFFIAANQTIPITVGAAVDVGFGGEDTIIWVDSSGFALDPDVDDPDDAIRAYGGGEGGGTSTGFGGGSGGGGGKMLPVSGGGSSTGGPTSDPDQGNNGGNGNSNGGISTCAGAAGGGGGSYGGVGSPGSSGNSGGEGGPSIVVTGWPGVKAGAGGSGGVAKQAGASGEEICGADFVAAGRQGKSYGGGGGGQGGGTGGSGGRAGVVMVRYVGPAPKLQPPGITSAETTDQNQNTICVDDEDWPPDAIDGYRARVEYAVNPTEPAATSGLWRLAGYLDAPGCVTTPPVPTGATVWSRAVAEAPGYLPSAPGDAVDEATPETPGLLALRLDISETGVATLSWTPNAFCDAVRIRGKIHQEGEGTARPLPSLEDLDAADGSYTLDDLVPAGFFATIDVECWEDGTYVVQGRVYRVSTQNPVRTIVTRADGLDALSDVELTDPQAPEVLAFDEYGIARNRRFRLDEWDEAADITALNATSGHHGLLPKLSGNVNEALRGDGTFGVVSSSEWVEVEATSDQDVTNSGTLTDDNELLFSAISGGLYVMELILLYSGSDATVDFKWNMTLPGVDICLRGEGTRSSANNVFLFGQARATGTTAVILDSDVVGGTQASHGKNMMRFWFQFIQNSATGNVRLKFANNTPAVGAVSRRLAGSILRYRRIA